MAETILVLVILVALGAFGWRRIIGKGRKMATLISRGTVAKGTVIKAEHRRVSRGNKVSYLRYGFETSGGIAYEREIKVLPRELADYSDGQPVAVVYDPVDPANNALKSAVDRVREAMGKPAMQSRQ